MIFVVLFGCNANTFSGGSSGGGGEAPDKPKDSPALPEELLPPKTALNECTETVDYNPEKVECDIPLTNQDSIWWQGETWVNAQRSFADKDASWISPLPSTDGKACPAVLQAEALIYISHFKVEKSAVFTIEAIIDDRGTVALWKDGDPKQEVFSVAAGAFLGSRKFELEPGVYSIIVKAIDYGKVATGMVVSVFEGNNVIKRSRADDSWCIFRANRDVNEKEFIPKVANCRSCLRGES
jgi:hypothetical protein